MNVSITGYIYICLLRDFLVPSFSLCALFDEVIMDPCNLLLRISCILSTFSKLTCHFTFSLPFSHGLKLLPHVKHCFSEIHCPMYNYYVEGYQKTKIKARLGSASKARTTENAHCCLEQSHEEEFCSHFFFFLFNFI